MHRYCRSIIGKIIIDRNPLVGVGRRGKETFEEECAADQKAVNELKQMLEFPSKENSAFYKQYKLLTA